MLPLLRLRRAVNLLYLVYRLYLLCEPWYLMDLLFVKAFHLLVHLLLLQLWIGPTSRRAVLRNEETVNVGAHCWRASLSFGGDLGSCYGALHGMLGDNFDTLLPLSWRRVFTWKQPLNFVFGHAMLGHRRRHILANFGACFLFENLAWINTNQF